MNLKIVKCFLWVIALIAVQAFSFKSFSQTPDFKFTHLTTLEGLSQNTVYAILKDYKGFMWFATEEGLNKYDGYNFTMYKHDASIKESINSSSVLGILEDDTKTLWIVTAAGLDKFDRVTETFIHYNCDNKGVVFRVIFQDKKKRIWLGTSEGLCLFDKYKATFKFFKNELDQKFITQNYVYKIAQDRAGDLWIGTRSGLNRFNPATEKFIYYRHDSLNKNSIGSGYVKTVYADTRGNIWAGLQGGGIALFNYTANSFINFKHNPKNQHSIGYNDILSFAEDTKANLWVGTENGGLSIYNYASNNFVTYTYNENNPFSISGNSVYSIYKDNNGSMWVGTYSGGVNFLPIVGDKFIHYNKMPNNSNSLSNNIVLSISGDSENKIWVGTDGGGLNCFDPLTHNFINYRSTSNNKNAIKNDYVLSTGVFLPGFITLGFHRGGMSIFDKKKQRFTYYNPHDRILNRLAAVSINCVYTDRQNNLWLGGHDDCGIYLFDTTTKTFTNIYSNVTDTESLRSSSISALYETKANQFWVAGDKGLELFNRDTKKFVHYQHDPLNSNSLSNNMVYGIVEDKEGNLWLSTAGGLNYFNLKKNLFKVYTEKDGLPNNVIWSAQLDMHGNVWVSTNKGLSKFNPLTKKFTNFTVSDGLQSNTFKPKASYQAPDGEMFFGGVNGFNTFYPDSIKDNEFIPPVYITDFQVFNKSVVIGGSSPLQKSINEVQEITLSYKQTVFSLEFAALNFIHPEQNNYAYKLDGFDKEWNYIGHKRTVTYTNLNAGTYTFNVKGSNNNEVWNQLPATIRIIILPPFWRTWWFALAELLLFLGAVVGFYLFRMATIEKQKVTLQQKVKEQTTELVHLNEKEHQARLAAELATKASEKARELAYSTNIELESKNKELEQFAYVASHDLQEPLRTTAGFVKLLQEKYSGKLDEKADVYLAFISDASERMRVLIKDLLEFSRIGTRRELVTIDCNEVLKNVLNDLTVAIGETDALITYSKLPEIKGYASEINILFQNLVINAIKFRKKNTVPKIDVQVLDKNGCLQFAFKDNGIGIEEKHREKIFDIFQRLHSRADYEGSGIGLAHCKKIVELHHGKIWVESVPAQGSTFYFTIPLTNNL